MLAFPPCFESVLEAGELQQGDNASPLLGSLDVLGQNARNV